MFIKDGIVYGGEPEQPIKVDYVKETLNNNSVIQIPVS